MLTSARSILFIYFTLDHLTTVMSTIDLRIHETSEVFQMVEKLETFKK